MTTIRPYPEYKPSGIEWLGDIPYHWQLVRLRLTLTSTAAGLWGDDPTDQNRMDHIRCIRVADFDVAYLSVSDRKATVRAIPQSQRGGRLLERGDILIEKSGGGENQPVGRVVLFDSAEPAVTSNFVSRLRVDHRVGLPKYLVYLMDHLQRVGITSPSIKQTTGIQNLDERDYLSSRIPLPPLSEQRAIADFLDAMDEKITRFIAARRRMIVLLEEQKQAIINQAVTRGLDPDVSLRPSGIDWLGDIPAHWEASRIRSVLSERNETNENGSETQILSVMSRVGVIPYEEKGNIGNKASEDISRYKLVRKNDLVLNSMNVIIGSVGISRYDGCLSPVYYVLRQNLDRITVTYAGLLFENNVFQKSLIRIGNGILAHRMRIPIEKLRAEIIPLPPLDEQRKIADFVSGERARVGKVSTRLHREIELMQEYRTRIISDVVTGKLDVQGVELPEVEAVVSEAVESEFVDVSLEEKVPI